VTNLDAIVKGCVQQGLVIDGRTLNS
jgi:hypothetical protein